MLYYNFQNFTCRAIVASGTILFVEGSIGWNYSYTEIVSRANIPEAICCIIIFRILLVGQ